LKKALCCLRPVLNVVGQYILSLHLMAIKARLSIIILITHPIFNHMQTPSIQTTLNLLRYHLDEVKLLTRNPCWKHYEYKYYMLTHGIAKLESLEGKTNSSYEEKINMLLKEYRTAFYNIL
jgi:hypothetical protein